MASPRIDALRQRLMSSARPGFAVVDQGMVSACNFLTVFLLARFMDVHAFGVFVIVDLVLHFLVSLHRASITQAHNNLGARLDGTPYRVFTTLLGGFQLSVALVFGVVIVAIGFGVLEFASREFGLALLALGTILPPWMTQEFVRRVHYTRQDTRKAFVNDFFSYGLQAAGIGALIITANLSIVSALFVLGATSMIGAIVGVIQLRGVLTFKVSDYPRHVVITTTARLVRFGRYLVAGELTRWFGRSGHTWMLSLLAGPAAVGAYKAGSHLVNVLNPIFQVTSAYLPSRVSRVFEKEGLDGMFTWLRRSGSLLLLPYTLIVVLIIVLADPILTLAYGDKFSDVNLYWIVVLGAVVYLLNFMGSFLEIALVAIERARVVFISSVFSIGLLFTSGAFFMSQYGVYGAPISQLIMSVVVMVYFWMVLMRIRRAGDDPLPGSGDGSAAADPTLPSVQPAESPTASSPVVIGRGWESQISLEESGVAVRKEYFHNHLDAVRQMARREYELLALCHELTAPISGVSSPRPIAFLDEETSIVMEFCDGVSAFDVVETDVLSSEEIASIGSRIGTVMVRYVERTGEFPADMCLHNMLYHRTTRELIMLDFGVPGLPDEEEDDLYGSEFVSAALAYGAIEAGVGEFAGAAIYEIARPARWSVLRNRLQYLQIFDALAAQVAREHGAIDHQAALTVARLAFRRKAFFGSRLRTFYYRILEPVLCWRIARVLERSRGIRPTLRVFRGSKRHVVKNRPTPTHAPEEVIA